MFIRLIAIGLLLLAGTTAQAKTRLFTQKFDDWTLVCADRSKDKNQCSVVQGVKSSAGWAKVLFAYDRDKLLIMLVVPPVAATGSTIAFGDGDAKQWIVRPICNNLDCRVKWYPAPDESVNSLITGSFIIVEYHTSKLKGVEYTLSTKGLRRAFAEIEKVPAPNKP